MPGPIRNPFVVSEGRFGRVLVAFMALGFLALVAAGVAAGWATGQNEEHTRSVNTPMRSNWRSAMPVA